MIVVADTSPLNYLVQIGAVDALKPLYKRVLIPTTVAEELKGNSAPAAVRTWIAQPPDWLEIRPDPPSDPTLQFLDPGEGAALSLAELVQADEILVDDWAGRTEAERPIVAFLLWDSFDGEADVAFFGGHYSPWLIGVGQKPRLYGTSDTQSGNGIKICADHVRDDYGRPAA